MQQIANVYETDKAVLKQTYVPSASFKFDITTVTNFVYFRYTFCNEMLKLSYVKLFSNKFVKSTLILRKHMYILTYRHCEWNLRSHEDFYVEYLLKNITAVIAVV
jgi:hypothetical protein